MPIRKKGEPVYRSPFNRRDMCEIGDFARWLGPGYHKDVPAWYLKDTGPRGKPQKVVVTRIRGPLDRERSGVDYAELKDGRHVTSLYLFPSKGYSKPRFILLQDNFGLAHNWVAFRRGAKLKPLPEDQIIEGAAAMDFKEMITTMSRLLYNELKKKIGSGVKGFEGKRGVHQLSRYVYSDKEADHTIMIEWPSKPGENFGITTYTKRKDGFGPKPSLIKYRTVPLRKIIKGHGLKGLDWTYFVKEFKKEIETSVDEDVLTYGVTKEVAMKSTTKKAINALKALGRPKLARRVEKVLVVEGKLEAGDIVRVEGGSMNPKYRNVKKSKGHVAFVGNFEFYVRNGEIIKAPLHNVFDLDGYRHGRWECPERMVKNLIGLVVEWAKRAGEPYQVEKKWAKKLGVKAINATTRKAVNALRHLGYPKLARKVATVLAAKPGRLDPKVKRKANKALIKAGLDGNGRFRKNTEAYAKALDVLSDFGIELGEVVSSHLFNPPEGQTTVDLAFSNPENPFSPTPITNSVLWVSWYKRDDGLFEAIAYLS